MSNTNWHLAATISQYEIENLLQVKKDLYILFEFL